MSRLILRAGGFAALLAAMPALAETSFVVHEDRIVDTVLSDGLGQARGAWRTRTQVIFDPATQGIERRTYEVFNTGAAPNLEFSWAADDTASDRAGRITGAGRLIWREADKPAYDDSGVVSIYRGTMRNGRAEGQGLYSTRDGLSYEGQWANGRPHGRGRLVLPTGEVYEGAFRDGFAEGAGSYTETTWERFEGTFHRGLRAGNGKTTLPSGLAYESHWLAGRETPNSLRVRIAQAGAAPAVGGTEDMKIGITMERRPKLPSDIKPKDILLYAARSTPEGLVVEPDDKKMVSVWVGKGELENHLYWGTEPRDGAFSIEPGYVQPAAFKLDFQNKSQQAMEIQSMSLVVRESMTENKPAIDITSPFVVGCNSSLTPSFTLFNYGWGKARNGRMQMGFVPGGSTARPESLGYTIPIGDLDQKKDINYEKLLTQAGVNLPKLKSYVGDNKTLPCETTDKAACLKSLQANPMFGKLAPHLRISEATVYVSMKGTYEYVWTDAKGREQTSSSPVNLPVGLGVIPNQGECGAGGPPEAIRTKPIKLKLDAENYVIPIPFRRAISPGRAANFTLALEADKSSRHQFEIVAKLADGREIKSPPISLLYYQPRPIKTN